MDGDRAEINGISYDFSVAERAVSAASSNAAVTEVKSELAAKVFKVPTTVGQQVAEGDVLVILEALKMEIDVCAPADGVVASLPVSVGQAVATGETVATLS
jgi:biotin carboxyl carrier protein